MRINKKALVLTDILHYCLSNNDLVFDNDVIKKFSAKHKFKNPFDVTHLETSKILPPALVENDVFVIHLGKGRHKFIKGISRGYHIFENVNNVENWSYRKSILNEFDSSESNILSVASNQKIIHDFLLQGSQMPPNIYFPRRSNITGQFKIDDQIIALDNQQIEIDLTLEHQGLVVVLEAKNKFHADFAIYQIYYPFLYYTQLKESNKLPITQIACCYLLRRKIEGKSVIKVYRYTFADPRNFTSIRLIQSKQYNLIGE